MTPTSSDVFDDDPEATPEELEEIERDRGELRDFVKGLSRDDLKSGNWFTILAAHALNSYTEKATWQYFQEQYKGVPADAIVDQRIKMAARYAALEGGLSAGAYTAAVAATLGSLGILSPVSISLGAGTFLVDLAFTTQLQLRLAYDIAVLYRVPLDLDDPGDLIKLIKVAFTIKGGEVVSEGLLKVVPGFVRPLVKTFYSRGAITAARGLPVVGKYLLQRNVIKIGIPLVGVPLAVLLNRWSTVIAGKHARAVFRNDARLIELAENLTARTQHPQLMLWVAWMVVVADRKIDDDEAFLFKNLIQMVWDRHQVNDEQLARVVDIDPEDVWRRLEAEVGDLSDIVAAARSVASVDGAMNARERAVLAELEERCARA